jgi:hypothetical protein
VIGAKGIAALALVLSGAAAAGCGPKVVRETVRDTDASYVGLRRTIEDDAPVRRGYEHPATVAGVRIAHILSSLVRETKGGQREPLIRNEHVYELADGLAAALAKAGPDDEIVAIARMRDRRFQLFTVDRVTSFRVFMRSGQLYVEFFAVEEQLEREVAQKGYEPPLELPRREPGWKLVPGPALAPLDARSVAVDWRDDYWRKPMSLRVRAGKLSRRTVLIESEESESPGPSAATPATDAQRRALDQLDAARRSGVVSEAEYQRRRRLVLEGRLPEAGYAEEPAGETQP